jgi:hypothetical protein
MENNSSGVNKIIAWVLIIILLVGLGFYFFNKKSSEVPGITKAKVEATAKPGELIDAALSQFVVMRDAVVLDSSRQVTEGDDFSSRTLIAHYSTHASVKEIFDFYGSQLGKIGYTVTSSEVKGTDAKIFAKSSTNTTGGNLLITVSPATVDGRASTVESVVGIFLTKPILNNGETPNLSAAANPGDLVSDFPKTLIPTKSKLLESKNFSRKLPDGNTSMVLATTFTTTESAATLSSFYKKYAEANGLTFTDLSGNSSSTWLTLGGSSRLTSISISNSSEKEHTVTISIS